MSPFLALPKCESAMTEVEFDRLLEALRMAIEPAPQEGRQPAPQLQNSVRSRRWPVERGHCDHSRTADIDHITVAGSRIRIDESCDQHTATDGNDLSVFLASRSPGGPI